MENTNESFVQLLDGISKSKDTSILLKTQKNTLRRYEETNEMLRQFLELSAATHEMLQENYSNHSKTLITLQRDLEICFKRIRELKCILKDKYPTSFEVTSHAIQELEEQYRREDEKLYENDKHSEDCNTHENYSSNTSCKNNEDISSNCEDLLINITTSTNKIQTVVNETAEKNEHMESSGEIFKEIYDK